MVLCLASEMTSGLVRLDGDMKSLCVLADHRPAPR